MENDGFRCDDDVNIQGKFERRDSITKNQEFVSDKFDDIKTLNRKELILLVRKIYTSPLAAVLSY